MKSEKENKLLLTSNNPESINNLTDTMNSLLEDIKLSSGKKSGQKKSKLKNLTNSNMNSVLDNELTLRIQSLNQEIVILKAERENLNENVLKYKEMSDDKDKQIEILDAKLKHMKDLVLKCEEEIQELSIKNATKTDIGGLSSKEAEKLQEENFYYKRIFNEKETQIEILNLNLTELTKTNSELSLLNDNLKDQISKRRDKEEAELSKLLESIGQLEREKSDLEKKLREANDFANTSSLNTSNLNSSFLSNYTTNDKDISEYKKHIAHLKSENRNINKKFDEMRTTSEIDIVRLKAEISEKDLKLGEFLRELGKTENDLHSAQDENKELFEENRKIKELNNDLQIKINHLERSAGNIVDLAALKLELEEIIKRKDNEIRELTSKNEENSQLIERNKKVEMALRNELNLKDNEITKRSEIIQEIQLELEKLSDENMNFKKEIFDLKAKIDIKGNETIEERQKITNEELSFFREKESKYEKFLLDMKEILNKKQINLNNKKKINDILVDIIKIKRGEVQCLEALKFTTSNNLKDSLTKIRDNEKALLAKIDEITNDPNYESDESDDDEEDEDNGDDGNIGSDVESEDST